MRKLLLKFNVNFSIRENGYENDYTTVGKQLKSYINCCFSVQYGLKLTCYGCYLCRNFFLENNFIVGVEPCLDAMQLNISQNLLVPISHYDSMRNSKCR